MPRLGHCTVRVGHWAFACLLTGCLLQGEGSTEFPAGLRPGEESTAPAPGALGEYPEEVSILTGDGDGYIYVHMRGYLRAPIADVWLAVQEPDVVADRRRTDQHTFTELEDTPYERAFMIHFLVESFLTVEWDNEYRFGAIRGTFDEPKWAVMKFQKVFGTDFITRIEGTVVLMFVSESITEITLVEHLDALEEDKGNLSGYAEDLFDEIVLHTKGQPLPEY